MGAILIFMYVTYVLYVFRNEDKSYDIIQKRTRTVNPAMRVLVSGELSDDATQVVVIIK